MSINEETGESVSAEGAKRKRPRVLTWLGRFVELVLVLAILAGSGWVAYNWIINPPQAERRPPKPQATLVEVEPVSLATEQVVLRNKVSRVIPAKSIQLAARVAGQIIEVNEQFVPGGMFAKSEEILRIDPKDYELAVKQQAGNVTKTETDIRLEMGQQAVARREFELLGNGSPAASRDLLLREPQLEAKQAALEMTQAALEKARLDLERTSVKAPFNAVVLERRVERGSYVAPGTPLATLAATDEFWVEVEVPVDELRWIDLPEPDNGEGAPARVYNRAAWGPGVYRKGRVVRLIPEVETRGLMARLLVAVEDPLQRRSEEKNHPLLLNAMVTVEIEGRQIENVIKTPRTSLREGNLVWIMSPEKRLEIKEVELVWGGPEYVLVSGDFSRDEKVVVSDLAAPVPGMLLRTGEEGDSTAGGPA